MTLDREFARSNQRFGAEVIADASLLDASPHYSVLSKKFLEAGAKFEAFGEFEIALTTPRIRDQISLSQAEITSVRNVYVAKDHPGEMLLFTNRVFVSATNFERVAVAAEKFKLEFVPSPSSSLYLLEAKGNDTEDVLSSYEKLADFLGSITAEPEMLLRHDRTSPKPAQLGSQWHLTDTQSGALSAWELTTGSPDIVVAVMDDGFDVSNPDLSDHIVQPSNFLSGFDQKDSGGSAIPENADPTALAERGDYHGTPCAGLAVAKGNSDIAGVAPGCSWMPVRFPVSMAPEGRILAIFRYISRHADVVSCSWAQKPSAYAIPSTAMRHTLSELVVSGGRNKNGLPIVFAAGNHGLPCHLAKDCNDAGLDYHDSNGQILGRFFAGRELHSGWASVDIPGVIVVGAITQSGEKSLYSNFGSAVTCVAPSDNWLPGNPSSRSQFEPWTLVTTDNHEDGVSLKDVGLSEHDPGFWTNGMGGTSGATPQVAGAIALARSVGPQLTAKQIEELLVSTCTKDVVFSAKQDLWNLRYAESSFDPETGRSGWFGAGRLNTAALVAAAGAQV